MRFTFTKEQDEFRQEIRDFLKVELEAGAFSVDIAGLVGEPSQEFSRKLAEKVGLV